MHDTIELARRIRRHAVEMTHLGKSSHVGSVLSMADIIAVLYGSVMNVDPAKPRWPGRDRFILSKGHAGAGIYAALAERGFFPVEKLRTHYQDGSDLSGHVSHKGIPGVEFSTGSLGHGLPVAAGMAKAAQLDGASHRVFVVLSDGECDEGSNWEAILFAAHHKLRNLAVIVDYNKIQSLAPVAETLALEPFADKWRSFGWELREAHGHDHAALAQALAPRAADETRPLCVLAHTTKGKGVSFMENSVLWHYRTPQGDEYTAACRELDGGEPAMRDAFVKALLAHAHADRRVMLVTGDLGFGVLTGFAKELPAQFINAGVAEQNMTGLAAGLALEGRNVFTYSIANFPTLRCLEQIRNDVIYHDASVNVVAIGGGFSYGALGMSHHATEDVAILRALPGLRVFAPCDELETVALVAQMVAQPAPTYLRLDKSKVAAERGEPFVPGRLRKMRAGDHVALVGYGGIVAEALAAADTLEADGIRCAVYSAHTLKPFDRDTLVGLARDHGALVTIEEHLPTGGLGSLAADTFLDAGTMPKRFARLCLPDTFSSIVGSQEYLRMRHGLDAPAIAARVRQLMGA